MPDAQSDPVSDTRRDPRSDPASGDAPSLADDPHVRAVLDAGGPFHLVDHRPRVTSTNDVARGLLVEGVRPGLVVVADRQTAGRGRAGRPWSDDLDGPEGPANLAVTATLVAPAARAELVTLVAGLAVADAYADAAPGVDVGLKWPNDVLLGGRKAAGILVERHRVAGHRLGGPRVGVHGTGDRDVLLVGCGLDLDWRGVERRDQARTWTSLAEARGGPVDRGAVLAVVLRALRAGLELLARDPDRLLAAYRTRCVTVGRAVEVTRPGAESLSGTAVAVDRSGRLVVEAGGRRVAVLAGDVTHVRPAGDH